MNKKLDFFLFLAVLIGSILVLNGCSQGRPAGSSNNSNQIFFYGDGCPHCANVEAYIKEHTVDEKIKFDQLEVFNNKDNAVIFTEKASICQIPQEKLGVPLFWDGSKCYEGDQEIIKFFKEKLDEK